MRSERFAQEILQRSNIPAVRRLRARLAATIAVAVLTSAFEVGLASAGDRRPLPDTIVVGATLPLTGLGAAYGTIMQEGMQLGFAEAEKSGVAGETKFKLEIRDSQALPAQSVSLTRDLVNAGAVAIVSAFTAPPLAQVPIAARSKIPVFNGGGNDPALLGRDYLWNDVMMLDQEAKVGMQYAAETLKAKKIGILFETSYTPTALSSIEAAWKDVGGTESVSETVDLAAASVGPQLEKLLAAKPDAIYLAIDGNISSLTFKELGQRNVKIPLITYSGGAVVPEAKSTPRLNLYFTTAAFETTPEFEAAAKQAGIKDISYYHVTYYNIAQTIVQSLKMAADEGIEPNGEAIERILQKSPDVSFVGCCGPVSYTKSHGANGKITVFQLIDGKPIKKADLDAS